MNISMRLLTKEDKMIQLLIKTTREEFFDLDMKFMNLGYVICPKHCEFDNGHVTVELTFYEKDDHNEGLR